MAVVEATKPAEFRILGPISVLVDGAPLALGGPKQRAVLGALLLRAGKPVGVEELIEAVWGDSPPPTAAKSVQVSVTNLRRVLGHERIRTHGSAYAVEVATDELDARHFEALATEGRDSLKDGDYMGASETLTGALALWRGRVCEGVAFESHVNADAERLEELHRAALHDRVEADLALGRHAQLVPELERLVPLYPLDEELRAQQMLALYRCGRQGDALRVYQDSRQLLVEQLGVEPGERLRLLQRKILEQDPRLDAPAETIPASLQVSQRRSPARYVAPAVVVLALAVGAVLALVEGGGSSGGHRTIGADAVGLLDAASGRFVAVAPAGPEPSAVAYADGSAWVADAGGETVRRIGLDGRVADTIPVGGNVTGVASAGDAIWAVSGERRTLVQIDPGTDTVVRHFGVGNGPRALAVGAGAVWVANGIDGTISRFDLQSGRLATIRVGGTPAALAFGSGALWVAEQDTNAVLRLDPRSRVITPVPVGHGPDAIAAGGGSVWVANGRDGTASRIDPATDSVTVTRPVGRDPTAVAVDKGAVWVGSSQLGSLTELAADTGHRVRRIRIGNSPSALARAGKHLWIAAIASPRSRRGGTLRLLGNTGNPGDPLPTFDPLDWTGDTWTVLAVTNDGLLGYRRVGGVEGNDVVPDLAQSMPTTGADGRSYTFTLRRGIRYSDGRLVQASDVRASVERIYKLAPSIVGALPLGLLGEPACLKHPRRCDLSRSIEANDQARTVTFHLSRPNPDFLRTLALPVWDVLPAGAPAGSHFATGPYRIASLKRGRLLLVRNTRFREWSADAQPQGFPNRISWNLDTSPAKGASAVLSGRADILMPNPPRLSSLSVRDPALLQSDRNGFVRYLFLNTRIPPFDNLDVRRAVNLAIDRAGAVTASGGPFLAEPTCELLPPNMIGYQPYCPYTMHPGPAGTWSAPALARARRLVARSGTKGARVAVWTQAGRPFTMAIGRRVASLLRSLGYRASVAVGPYDDYYSIVANAHTHAQIGVADWGGANSPADFFRPLLTCAAARGPNGFNLGRFCDRRIDRMIARGEWAAADRAAVNQAALVPLVATRQVTLISRRVGNYQHNPVLDGPLIDQLWLSKPGSLSVP